MSAQLWPQAELLKNQCRSLSASPSDGALADRLDKVLSCCLSVCLRILTQQDLEKFLDEVRKFSRNKKSGNKKEDEELVKDMLSLVSSSENTLDLAMLEINGASRYPSFRSLVAP